MSDNSTGTKDMTPHFEDIQAHYDLSDDFFGVFQDPTRKYSCAYFTGPNVTLSEAQIANVDQHLDRLDLKPGMTLLEVGCGWGLTLQRAMEKYDVNVIGLTLSQNQHDYVQKKLANSDVVRDSGRSTEVRLQGWEEFTEPVDRILSIGAFEHFRYARHAQFFEQTYAIMPADGRMMLHSIIAMGRDIWRMGRKITREDLDFWLFIAREIFPGGELPQQHTIPTEAEKAGYTVAQIQSLQPHYARTLDFWADALEARHDDAVRVASEETYQTYMRYLRGCADRFHWGHSDVRQYTLVKQP